MGGKLVIPKHKKTDIRQKKKRKTAVTVKTYMYKITDTRQL